MSNIVTLLMKTFLLCGNMSVRLHVFMEEKIELFLIFKKENKIFNYKCKM